MATTYEGTIIRLEKTAGTVTILDADGKAVVVQDGIRLTDGYVVKTGAKSTAYLSVDSKAVVRLEADGELTIRSGGKLKIEISKGTLTPGETAQSGTNSIAASSNIVGVRG